VLDIVKHYVSGISILLGSSGSQLVVGDDPVPKLDEEVPVSLLECVL
jgi:hypothetical protein